MSLASHVSAWTYSPDLSTHTALIKAILQGPKLEDGPSPMDSVNANGVPGSSAASAADMAGNSNSVGQQIEEDPENEFTGAARYEAGMPRIINVGIDGPGTG